MIKLWVRSTHACWRSPGYQLLFIIIFLISVLLWAYFGVASVPGPGESFAATAEERLIVLGAGAAASIALWGVVGQWSISRRQQTITFLRALETDADYIKALKRFNRVAQDGTDLKIFAHAYKHSGKKPKTRKSRERLRRVRERHEKTNAALCLILNTDEMIAIGVKNSILDYRVVCSYRRMTTIRRYQVARNYIREMRSSSRVPTTWVEMERMATKMEKDAYHHLL